MCIYRTRAPPCWSCSIPIPSHGFATKTTQQKQHWALKQHWTLSLLAIKAPSQCNHCTPMCIDLLSSAPRKLPSDVSRAFFSSRPISLMRRKVPSAQPRAKELSAPTKHRSFCTKTVVKWIPEILWSRKPKSPSCVMSQTETLKSLSKGGVIPRRDSSKLLIFKIFKLSIRAQCHSIPLPPRSAKEPTNPRFRRLCRLASKPWPAACYTQAKLTHDLLCLEKCKWLQEQLSPWCKLIQTPSVMSLSSVQGLSKRVDKC